MPPSDSHIAPNRRGVEQLVRRWPVEEPWAAMLIVHGLGEHSGRYEATGGRFASAGIDVTAFDLVGFGASGGDRAYIPDWSHHLDDVEDRLAEVRTAGLPTVLLGHSLGGLLAASYVIDGRPRPDVLVLSAPALDAETPVWQRKGAPLLSRLAPKAKLPNPISGEQLSRDPAVGEAYFADPLVYTSATLKLGAEIFAAMDRTTARLTDIDLPTLVIHGGADTLVAPRFSAPLGDLPGVDRILYPKLRHESFNEPEGADVVSDVVSWIERRLRA